MKAWLRRARRLPGQIATAGIRTNTTKQVDAPTLAALRLVNPMVPGNAHRNYHAIFFNLRGGRHVRMKLPIRLALLGRPVNRHVKPLAGRRGFEFQIALDRVFVGRDENLADVPIPKSHRLLFDLRSRADNQRLRLIADEANMQRLARPENPRLGRAAGRSFGSGPVAIDAHRLGLVPLGVLQIGDANVSGRMVRGDYLLFYLLIDHPRPSLNEKLRRGL